MRRNIRWFVLPLLAALVVGAAMGGRDEEPSATEAPSSPAKTPEQQAREHYGQGLEAQDNAWKLEKRAEAAQTVEEREQIIAEINSHYAKAREAYEKAVALDSSFHQAYNGLGYASRKLGDFQLALRAYDTALQLDPEYAQAIEYRAEAYLGLGQVEKAKETYMQLFNLDREQADELLNAMKRWIRDRKDSPDAPGADQADALADWVDKRAEIATQGGEVSRNGGRGW